jgi:sigma-E factor negative regulatory protein RseC
MEIRAEVRSIEAGEARLACESPQGCGLCGEGGGCGTRLFGSGARRWLRLPSGLPGVASLAPGDRVMLSVADGELVQAAALAYLLPVAGLLGGAVLARFAGAVEAMALVLATCGALLGVWLGRRLGARRSWTILPGPIRPASQDD